jgi:hypothetical protein
VSVLNSKLHSEVAVLNRLVLGLKTGLMLVSDFVIRLDESRKGTYNLSSHAFTVEMQFSRTY